MTTTNKPNTMFWVTAGVALIWNLMGVGAYLADAYASPEMVAARSVAEQALYNARPAWATAAFATAVFGGALGCILLLLRKKIATPVLIVSLIGILVQFCYNFFLADTMDVYGPGSAIMPAMVIVIGVYLVWYSKKCEANGVIN
jgi:hypothetical protein